MRCKLAKTMNFLKDSLESKTSWTMAMTKENSRSLTARSTMRKTIPNRIKRNPKEVAMTMMKIKMVRIAKRMRNA